MANKIKVNTTRLNADANEVAARISSLKKEMAAMKQSVNQMNSMWTGEAKNAFVQAFNDDMNALNTLINNFEAIHRFEVNAKTKYDNCERQVEQLVNSIKA